MLAALLPPGAGRRAGWAAFVSLSAFVERFNHVLCFAQTNPRILLPVEFDGCNLSIGNTGQSLHFWGHAGRWWRRHFYSLMLEQGVQLLLKLLHLECQKLHFQLRAFCVGCASGKKRHDGCNDGVVAEFQNSKAYHHLLRAAPRSFCGSRILRVGVWRSIEGA